MSRTVVYRFSLVIILLAWIAWFSGCAAPSQSMTPQYVDPSSFTQGISGVGFESQDVRALSTLMVNDLLAENRFAEPEIPPRIIIDDTRFKNESSQVFNINMLLERLRIELMKASEGKLEFVSRQNLDLVLEERSLSQSGLTDEGTKAAPENVAGADYRLIGRITSQSTASNTSGIRSNYFQVSFEILDLDSGLSVWGNVYDMKKAGADDTIYR